MGWDAVEQAIKAATGSNFRVEEQSSVGGGCINEARVITGAGRHYFVKRNRPQLLDMFEAEAAGLAEIIATGAIAAPAPVCQGSDARGCFLVLEHIPFGRPQAHSSALLGEQLAALHRATAAGFGWHRDNTIGATPQVNDWGEDWPAFYASRRLGFQLDLAARNGAPARLIEQGRRLQTLVPAFFKGYSPAPSLLHGDLWGGNWGTDTSGKPVIFDPAVYYGDREADLAMTELFGGFDERFYQSYRQAWSWDAGYRTRKVLYNLYHVLNHFNLFGGGYAAQAQDMVCELIAEVS